MASCVARPYASRRDPGRHARRHPERGRAAPACLAGVDRHRGRHAALDRRRSRTGRAGALRMGGGRELRGWATAARNWWSSDPQGGILAITVDGSHRGEGIGTALAEAADEHLGRLGVRTTRAGSLDEPGARALASRRGFEEIAAATVSGVDPRTVEPRPIPAGVELVPLRGHRRPRARPRAGPRALPRHPERGLRRDRARGVEGRRSGRARCSTTTRAWWRSSTGSWPA